MIYLYEKCHYFIKNLNLEGDIGYFSVQYNKDKKTTFLRFSNSYNSINIEYFFTPSLTKI